jgi:uncharacterized protein YkwD
VGLDAGIVIRELPGARSDMLSSPIVGRQTMRAMAAIIVAGSLFVIEPAFGRMWPPPPPPPRQGACAAVLTDDVVEQVNATRRHAGLRPLATDDRLSWIARQRSAAMAADQELSHRGWDRALREGGVRGRIIGENVAANYDTAASVMRTWLASSGHRANIVDPRYRRIGVGCVVDPHGQRWWTQVFEG